MPLTSLFTASAAAPYAWSVLLSGAVVVLSIVPLGAARSQADFTMADMGAPRAMFERLPTWGRRASWAHQNSFEAFTLHAPAALLCVIAALHSGALPNTAITAALLQPLLRLLYIGAYVGNVPPLRGLCWASALLCTGTLYIEGLRALLATA
jgi:uncharacterized MAPEG superfamily protein